jgi:hypothetical protein
MFARLRWSLLLESPRMRRIRYAPVAFGALLLSEAFAQPSGVDAAKPLGHGPGAFSVGFQLLEAQDDSRTITARTAPTPRPRPMRTYLWYPAERSAQTMAFGRYVRLADEDIWPPEIAGDLREQLNSSRRPPARSLGPTGFEALLRRPVGAAENAKPLDGPFPLIVIAQGWSVESPITFSALSEYLASHGFVVASAPLAGTNSPLVRITAQDVETEVRDVEFVIAQVRRHSFVSAEKLGLFGFDLGGMAGLILAMRNPDVDAFASISGILHPHPSGLPRSLPSYDPLALRIPWWHGMTDTDPNQPPDSDAISLLDQAVHSNRYKLVADGMRGHVDFSSYALIEERLAVANWPAGSAESAARYRIIAAYLYNFFAAYLMQRSESVLFLSQDPMIAFPGSRMRIEHREAAPPQ